MLTYSLVRGECVILAGIHQLERGVLSFQMAGPPLVKAGRCIKTYVEDRLLLKAQSLRNTE